MKNDVAARPKRNDLWVAFQIALVGLLATVAISLAEPGVLPVELAWLSYSILVAVIGLVGVIGWGWLARKREFAAAWLHPPVLITGYVVLLVGVPGLFIFLYPKFFGLLLYEYLAWGMAVVLVGVASLWMGYAAGWRLFKPLQILRGLHRYEVSPQALLLLYAATILARVARILVQGVAYEAHGSTEGVGGSLDQWISYLEGMRYLILAIVALKVFRGVWHRWFLLTILAVEIAYALSSGFMKPMFWIAVITLISAAYVGVNLRQYTRYIFLLGLASILVVPIAEGLRLGIQAGVINTHSPAAAISSTRQVFATTWGRGAGVGWEMFVQKVPGRFAAIAYMPGLAMSRTPSYIPFLGYDEMLAIPLNIIPRTLWPDKPSLSRGRWFSSNYLDLPPEVESSTALTLFGESYLYGGWPTVVIGLFALGMMLAVVFMNTAGIGLAALYIGMLPGVVDVETELGARLVSLFQGLLFTFALYLLMVGISAALRSGRVGSRFSTNLPEREPTGVSISAGAKR